MNNVATIPVICPLRCTLFEMNPKDIDIDSCILLHMEYKNA